ncbi:eukaryotic translation initiation factor 4 gamma 1-like isoform X2 [Acipenser ruthenus]|uniref:eukaryotic translation initiation factor 4 gamma 1-like isoform X2 n=1 Tax=Acipenser ruthenus TaxID=7906 RepID=UPI00274233EF|nr:eukaryotic translation initiation factor 4 gamma 1-like isoform X2 [Acipenser ruthenus]
MNKAPQPLTGPPTAPHPSPSPGLSQPTFPPGQPAPVVFATPQPSQMNTPPQPRQFAAGPRALHQQGGFRSLQQYYANRPQPPSSTSRVQASTAPRPVAPTHVYQPGSQMMMIPQQLPFPTSQGPYYIPGGQYRNTYVAPTQQYPVPTGTPSFYPGTSPAEYGTYAGAYYPAQGVQQYPPTVPSPTVMMNPAQQIPPKRERKQIRIRDPNQGGKDITEEIMSGGRTTSTPTPPQSTGPAESSTAQANGENPHPVTVVIRPDDRQKPAAATVKLTREPDKTETTLTAAGALPADETETDTKPAPSEKAPEPQGVAPANTTATSLPAAVLLDTVDSQTALTPPLTNAAPQEQAAEEAVAAPVLLPAAVEQPAAVETPLPVAAEMRPEEPAPEREEEVVPPVEQEEVVVPPLVEQEVVVPLVEQEVVLAVVSVPVEGDLPAKELPTETNGVTPEPATIQEPLPPTQPQPPPAQVSCEAPLESPIAQPEELNMPNGLAGLGKQDPEPSEEQPESDISPIAEPEVAKAQEAPVSVPAPCTAPVPTPTTQPAVEEEEEEEEEEAGPTQSEPQPTSASAAQGGENVMQAAAVSIPKKKRKMKDLNKKEMVGDLLDAFKESQVSEPEQAQPAAPISAEPEAARPPAPEETDETWEEKEDKLDTENIEPDQLKPGDLKYKYKEEQWKPINPEEKKQYDREFLLGFQFIVASMQKPEGLPHISDVVLDKANKNPLRALDPSRLTSMNAGPDFTPSYANLGRQPMGGRGPPSGMGPRRSQQGQRKEPRKIIATVSLGEDVQLNKAEKAWKPGAKRPPSKEEEDTSSDNSKTQELFRRVRGILNKLTPQMFQQLMKQVTELTIDTEERLKGVIDLIFEKAISEPNFSVAYANMCRCLMGLKVSTTDKPGVTVNFRKLLLNRCQKEFEKDKDDDEVFEKKQKELDAAAVDDEKQRLREELEEAKDTARRRSLGNIKFIGELFKLKMLTEPIMHDCIVKLLKNHDEESLECLCRLLSTIGKDLDFEKAKPRMDQYFNQMEKIIKEKKTSSRIRFMLQDVIDLRRNTWVPRRGEQGPKTLDQIHKEAELEEHREQIKVQQQLLSKKDNRRGGGGGQGGAHPSAGRPSQPQDEGWNTVPISTKNRPIDTSRLSKITKPGALDFNNQLLAPGGRLMSWGKGSSGGSNAKPNEQAPESGRTATSTLNRFSALQQASSSSSSSSFTSTAADSDARRVVQRTSSSRERSDKGERYERDRFERQQDRADKNRPSITKRSYSKETDDRSRERELRGPQDPVRRVASMTEDRERRGSREREHSKETVKQEPAAALAPTPAKPALTEDEFDKKSKAIIEEYLHINDMKEALQCVQEMNSVSLLFVFVRNGIESTLERSMIAREHMGLLLHQLVKAGTLSTEQYYKGLLEILEIAEDMEIDIPHIWLYLAELIAPMLHEGGIPMEELFKEVSKPLVPLGKAGLLLVEILSILCKGMSHKKAGALWREAGLSWKDFLPEDEDVNKFVTEKKVEFTLGDDSEKTSKKELSSEELCRQLDKLLKEKADNQRIYDWVEANLDEQQVASNTVIRAVMTSICQSAIIFENPCRLDNKLIVSRSKVLQKYLTDEQKELQALYALQALLVKLEQPPNLLRMFFDALYDEDVIKEEAFYKWELSKDPAELQGKGVALKSVTAFFTWLREAEDESDN